MNNLQITEYKNIRVLTTQQIAEAYGTDSRVISNNYNRNKERYVEGKHFICLEGDELKNFKTNHQFDESSRINKLYLWTEKGAFLHAKSLNTDTAWEVYDRLVDNYFEKPKAVPMTTDQKIQLLAQGNVELTEKVNSIDKDLQEFKQDMPLLALECQRITCRMRKAETTIVANAVVNLIGVMNSEKKYRHTLESCGNPAEPKRTLC